MQTEGEEDIDRETFPSDKEFIGYVPIMLHSQARCPLL